MSRISWYGSLFWASSLQRGMQSSTNCNPVLANLFSKLFRTLLFEIVIWNIKQFATFCVVEWTVWAWFSSSLHPFPSFNYDYLAVVFDWMFFCPLSVFYFLIPFLFSQRSITFPNSCTAINWLTTCQPRLFNLIPLWQKAVHQRKRSWVGARLYLVVSATRQTVGHSVWLFNPV